MKRILTSLALLGAFAFNASAQRSIDLQMLHAVPSTIIIDSVNLSETVIAWGIVNNGPASLQITDTVKWSTPSGTYRYIPTAVVPMGDTLGFSDTLQLTNGPVSGPFQWCDSVWAIPATGTITDPVPTNNKTCAAVTLNNRNGQTSIGDVFKSATASALTVYPNPSSTNINFKFSLVSGTATVRVMDIAGRTLLVKEFGKQAAGEKELSIDISSLNNGLYYVELVNEEMRATSKFSVSK